MFQGAYFNLLVVFPNDGGEIIGIFRESNLAIHLQHGALQGYGERATPIAQSIGVAVALHNAMGRNLRIRQRNGKRFLRNEV